MGCCFSSPTTQIHNKNQNNKTTQKNNQHEPPPPPPTLEEESVKEVLTETPISKPHQVPIFRPETKTLLPLHEKPPPNFETKPKDNPVEEVSETVSQLSETCSMSMSMSMSESFSAATTTTVTEKREEDEATSKIHKWDQSPSRKRPYPAEGNLAAGRERRVKSLARKPEPSSENKIKGGPRPIRGRESVPAANRRRNASPATLRQGSGNCSSRRSKSPACGRIGKSGASIGPKEVNPAKVVVNEVEKEKSESESEEVIKSESERERNDVVSQQEECLENPHVSMECFIFL